MIYDETKVRKTIALMKPGNQTFEVRVKYKDKSIYSGYFHDADNLIAEMQRLPKGECNAYITLNEVHPALMSRSQAGRFTKKSDATTSDNDIVAYSWLMIDLDPQRPADTSSSGEELQASKDLGQKVYKFMQTVGFNDPLMAMSGNGYHLLYAICVEDKKRGRELVETCLKTLDAFFSTDETKVDISVFNPARICKLYGTVAEKGISTEDRPHRMSYIFGDKQPAVTDTGYLQKLADMYPKKDEAQKYNRYGGKDFNITEWMTSNGLQYQESSYSGGTKYILDHCPFNSDHKHKDAAIFKTRDGCIGFKCLHNSCADKTWRDVRVLFEPDAYDKQEREYRKKIYGPPNFEKPKPQLIDCGEPVWQTAMEILDCNDPDPEYLPTGWIEFDRKERGLAKGDVSVITGYSGSGKSSATTELSINVRNAGYKVAVYSGEMNRKKVLNWVFLMSAGRGNLEDTNYPGYYTVNRKIRERIAEWLGDYWFLYNNKCGHNFVAIMESVEKICSEKNIDLLILDNLMRMDIRDLSEKENEAQKEFLKKLKDIAAKYNIHITVICHPRKVKGMLRLPDISGSGDIRNLADEILMFHRINEDFKRDAMDWFGWKDSDPLFQADNAIEIGKSRDGANADSFIPLYFERETKRLKNSETENIIYGWDEDDDGFATIDDMDLDEVAFFENQNIG